MKKTLLLALTAFLGMSAGAQMKGGTRIAANQLAENEKPHLSIAKPSNSHTRSNSRWYDPTEASLVYFNGDTTGYDANTYYTYLWQDSTMRVRYATQSGSTYLGGIQNKSWGQILDPFANRFNNIIKVPNYIGEMQVKPTDAYTLDTVAIEGYYKRIASKSTVVDTLVVTVGYGNLSGGVSAIGARYVLNPTNATTLVNCYTTDTMTIGALDYNFATMGLVGNNVVVYKRPLTIADSGFHYFTAPFNLAVPAGNLLAMSYSFKSGDTWTPNVDTINNFNSFRALYTEEVTGAVQHYEKKDYNSTQTLENDTTGWGTSYVPNFVYIGATGCSGDFPREQYATLFHITSNSTSVLAIHDINKNISANAYPNPASGTLNFNINLVNAAKNVTVVLTNAVGQIVKTINVGAVTSATKASMDITNVTKGFYTYSIIADGARYTNKVIVE